jgi:hypothetical protein
MRRADARDRLLEAAQPDEPGGRPPAGRFIAVYGHRVDVRLDKAVTVIAVNRSGVQINQKAKDQEDQQRDPDPPQAEPLIGLDEAHRLSIRSDAVRPVASVGRVDFVLPPVAVCENRFIRVVLTIPGRPFMPRALLITT